MSSARRRQLNFDSFDALAVDVDRLRDGGYTRAGAWTLGQVCDHLSRFMRASIEGFSGPVPLPIRFARATGLGRLILRRTLKVRRIPEGVKGPADVMPGPAALDERAAVEAFRKAMADVRDHAGDFQPSPLFGPMTAEQWRQIHLIHAAHHLSFLLPNGSSTPGDSAGNARPTFSHGNRSA